MKTRKKYSRAHRWVGLKRDPCTKCGRDCQRPDGICWRCAQGRKS